MTPERKVLVSKIASHGFLVVFLIFILVPFIMVISASFSEGNLAPSRLIPEKFSLDHWKFVLGIPYQEIADAATGETRLIKPETPPL
ncbi:MAG: hypothetical protein WA376_08985, partial [Terrimicrobiaceae bacterium]